MSPVSYLRLGNGIWRMVLALVRQRRRLWLATVAVALSVGYLAGALTLLNRVSDGLADMSAAGSLNVDLVVEGDVAYQSALEQTRRLIPSSIADALVGVDGIASVVPRVEDVTILLDSKGDPLVAPGLSEQPMGTNFPEDPKVSPYEFVGTGRAPETDDEVVIDHRSAEVAKLGVGDSIQIATRGGVDRFNIVGVVTTANGDLPNGSTLALFTISRARQLFGMADNDNSLAIRLEPGADLRSVQSSVASLLPAGAEVVDGTTGALHRQESLTRSFTLIRVLITAFAGLALAVGMVTVANSLTLLYSERRQSFATFRLVGAKQHQLLGASLAEAALLASVASLIGAPLGLVIGAVIEAVLGALGTAVPVGGSFVSFQALGVAILVGVAATVMAAVIPAWKACRVPPIEAIIEAKAQRDRPLGQRLLNGLFVSVSAAALVWGFMTIGDSSLRTATLVALGIVLVGLAGIAIPVALAQAVALGIRAVPDRSGALRRIGARDAVRNRTRTAATTGALLVATAVVSGLAVFLASFASSLDTDVSKLINADLVIDSGTFTVGGLPADLLDRVATLDDVAAVSGWEVGRAYVGDRGLRLTGMNGAALDRVISPGWVGAAPGPLSENGIAISKAVADELHVAVGDVLPVRFTSEATVVMTVEGIFSSGGVMLGDAVLNRSLLMKQVPKSVDIAGLVSFKNDTPAARRAVSRLAAGYGVKSIIKPEDFVDSRSDLLRGFERVIQWMLLFTLVQALIGVVNTLLLSVGERRREFGLLRAAGASRAQVLRLVLVEGGSFAVVGTVIGLVLGILGAKIGMAALAEFGISGFVVPIPVLLVTAVAAAGLGVLAAVVPARWAASVPPLEAVVDSGGAPLRAAGAAQLTATLSAIVANAGRRPANVQYPPRRLEPTEVHAAVRPATSTRPVTATGVQPSTSTATSPDEATPQPPPFAPSEPDVTSTIAAAALARSVLDDTAREQSRHPQQRSGNSSRSKGGDARWLKPTRDDVRGRRGGDDRDEPFFEPEREPKTIFTPSAGNHTMPMDVGRAGGGQPMRLPPTIREALTKLDPRSVDDAMPTLGTLASVLGAEESVSHLVQGWAKGLPCVVARTDNRLIVVVSRFPEPLVESLHPTRTEVSLYGPPGMDRVSVSVVDGQRLLEVNGVRDRAEAQALRTEPTGSRRRSRGYF